LVYGAFDGATHKFRAGEKRWGFKTVDLPEGRIALAGLVRGGRDERGHHIFQVDLPGRQKM
jgi:nucleoside-triphosphatase THEP1